MLPLTIYVRTDTYHLPIGNIHLIEENEISLPWLPSFAVRSPTIHCFQVVSLVSPEMKLIVKKKKSKTCRMSELQILSFQHEFLSQLCHMHLTDFCTKPFVAFSLISKKDKKKDSERIFVSSELLVQVCFYIVLPVSAVVIVTVFSYSSFHYS